MCSFPHHCFRFRTLTRPQHHSRFQTKERLSEGDPADTTQCDVTETLHTEDGGGSCCRDECRAAWVTVAGAGARLEVGAAVGVESNRRRLQQS